MSLSGNTDLLWVTWPLLQTEWSPEAAYQWTCFLAPELLWLLYSSPSYFQISYEVWTPGLDSVSCQHSHHCEITSQPLLAPLLISLSHSGTHKSIAFLSKELLKYLIMRLLSSLSHYALFSVATSRQTKSFLFLVPKLLTLHLTLLK